ncbi:hypothetical protein [Maricaulis parjimensis]|uniref:hypothetical protein n=1 Tax=Maricaulis parjimensis TaxID=144023 RepID=UPI001939A8D5|nr:hypothetical protein [Maricaulis parjimensis]
MTSIKTLAAALVLSTLGSAAFAGAASADTWVLNASACPDLREDRHDSRVTTSRADLREDYEDRRVINCPPRAWRYEADRWDARLRPARFDNHRFDTPGTVYRARNGGFYIMDRWGDRRWIDVRIEYPRGRYHDRRYRFDDRSGHRGRWDRHGRRY